MQTFIRSLKVLGLFAVLLCGAYPVAVTVFGQLLFKEKALGSLVQKDGKLVGSTLIGQSFTRPEYFQGRPSAAGNGYDAANSSGSNLGPTSKKLMDRIQADVDRVRKENPSLASAPIPTELVTASASGLDPHVSPQAAEIQIPRVAAARGMDPSELKALVAKFVEGPEWGLFGDSRVKVFELNLELDKTRPIARP